MDYPNHTTVQQAGKHLTYEDYITFQIRLKDGWTANKIAVTELHCAPNTVRNIIKKGMPPCTTERFFDSKPAQHGRHIEKTAVIAAGTMPR